MKQHHLLPSSTSSLTASLIMPHKAQARVFYVVQRIRGRHRRARRFRLSLALHPLADLPHTYSPSPPHVLPIDPAYICSNDPTIDLILTVPPHTFKLHPPLQDAYPLRTPLTMTPYHQSTLHHPSFPYTMPPLGPILTSPRIALSLSPSSTRSPPPAPFPPSANSTFSRPPLVPRWVIPPLSPPRPSATYNWRDYFLLNPSLCTIRFHHCPPLRSHCPHPHPSPGYPPSTLRPSNPSPLLLTPPTPLTFDPPSLWLCASLPNTSLCALFFFAPPTLSQPTPSATFIPMTLVDARRLRTSTHFSLPPPL